MRDGFRRAYGLVQIPYTGSAYYATFLIPCSPSNRVLRIKHLHDASKNRINTLSCKPLWLSSYQSSFISPSSQIHQSSPTSGSHFICRQFHKDSPLNQEIRTVPAPQFAESITEGDLRWEKAVGDAVAEDELIAEVETDKTTVPINSPVAGVIEELLVEDGSTVNSGQPIFKIRVGAAASPKQSKSQQTVSDSSPPPSSTESSQTDPPPVYSPPSSPPPVPPQPTGPMLSTPVSTIKSAISAHNYNVPSSEQGKGGGGGVRNEERVKMNRMRLRISQRLKDAQNTYAMLTTFNEIDMR